MPKFKNVSRAIVLVLSLLFVLGGCSTTKVEEKDPPNERHPLQVVEECPLVMQTGIELSGSKPHLYFLANDWIDFILTETEDDILYRDPEEGVVVGRGVITQSSGKVDYEFEYELTVEAVDNMVTTTIVSSLSGLRSTASTTWPMQSSTAAMLAR